MFRKIKKLYFKIYHLFKLLSVFILIFGLCNRVYAEEYNTCFDKYKVGIYKFGTMHQYFIELEEYIPVEPNTKYYIKFFTTPNFTGTTQTIFSQDLYATDINKNSIGTCYKKEERMDYNEQTYTFKTCNKTNIAYIKPWIYTYNNNYGVLENTPIVMSTNLEDLGTCPEVTPTQDSVYTSFLTLYTDKINYLANGFTSNPYLLAMIGIIFSFVVLELFLKILHLKGGKYR